MNIKRGEKGFLSLNKGFKGLFMIPKEEELIKFIKSKDLVNFSSIAKHFNIQNVTVSDIVKDLEAKKLAEVVQFGGNKFIKLKENKMKKRGQVTTYIILGILIVLVVGITVYLTNTSLRDKFDIEREKIQVTKEFIPLKNYFDSCIGNIALEGSKRIGIQGGYLNIPNDGMPVTPRIPFSNKLQVFGNDALEVPYWFYESANGIQKTQIPTVKEMEKDLQDYISFNLNNCLNNFTQFSDYEVSGFSNIETKVTIDDDKIFVNVLGKLTSTYKGLTQEFDEFIISIDAPLGRMYKIANGIITQSNQNNFFEELTYDMMVVYDEIPLSETEFSCEQKIWGEEQVKKDFKKIVSKNINEINLKNGNKLNSKKYFFLDADSQKIDASFSYNEDWPFYMEVTPSENGVLKSDEIVKQTGALRFLTQFFCLNNYHFVYDVKYPVLITLNKGNHIFEFAYQVIIDNNQPKKDKIKKLDSFESFDLCDKKITKTKVSTYIIDENENLAPLDKVKISYKCFSNTCDIGETKLQENGVFLEEDFPQCINGQIIADKKGYSSAKVTTSTNLESSVSLTLEKLYNLDLNLKLIDKYSGEIRNLNSNENALIKIEGLDNDLSFLISYPEIDKIELAPGNYKSTIYVNTNKNIKINGQEIENCVSVPKGGVLGLFFDETKCVKNKIDGFELTQALVGGAEFELEIERQKLINADFINLYAIYDKIPNTNDEILRINDELSAYSKNKYFKYPELK